MTCRSIRYSVITALAVAAGLALAPLAEAQYGAEGGAVQAPQNQTSSVAMPRTPDGKPDLSGFWGGGGGGAAEDAEPETGNLTVLNRSRGCHPGMKICTGPVNQSNDSTFNARYDANRPLYKPEYWAKVRDLDLNSNTTAPYFICQSAGVPLIGAPAMILQTKDNVVFLYGQGDFRIIPTDGRPHDKIKSLDLLFHGHSVAKWEGDTLVVDSVAFNDLTWLGQGGYFHTDQMRVIERFRREGDAINYQATVIDPGALVEPWVMNPRVLRLNTNKNANIAERNPCEERDQQHMVGTIHH